MLQSLRDFLPDYDGIWIHDDLWSSYQVGIVIGIVFVTTLHVLFAGRQDAVDTVQAAAEERKRSHPRSGEEQVNKPPTDTTTARTRDDGETTAQFQNPDTDRGAANGSPHGQLNAAVYVVLIGVTVYVLNHEYPGILEDVLRRYLPREAALLGFQQ